MIENKDIFPNEGRQYRSPEVKVVFVSARCVLCDSGNGSMSERDLGDGGFH